MSRMQSVRQICLILQTSKAAKTSSLMGNDDGEEEEDEDDEEDSLRRKASAIHASLALTPLYTIPKVNFFLTNNFPKQFLFTRNDRSKRRQPHPRR